MPLLECAHELNEDVLRGGVELAEPRHPRPDAVPDPGDPLCELAQQYRVVCVRVGERQSGGLEHDHQVDHQVGDGEHERRSRGQALGRPQRALKFNTKTLSAKAGTVTISMNNPAPLEHGIAVEGNGVNKDGKIVGQGSTSVLALQLKAGKYTFFCPVPGHREAGMQGTLTVT